MLPPLCFMVWMMMSVISYLPHYVILYLGKNDFRSYLTREHACFVCSMVCCRPDIVLLMSFIQQRLSSRHHYLDDRTVHCLTYSRPVNSSWLQKFSNTAQVLLRLSVVRCCSAHCQVISGTMHFEAFKAHGVVFVSALRSSRHLHPRSLCLFFLFAFMMLFVRFDFATQWPSIKMNGWTDKLA